MDKDALKRYLEELSVQCEYALGYAQDVYVFMQREAIEEQFRAIYGLLTHAGNVSKLLWVPEEGDSSKWKRALERAIELRQVLGLPDAHILRDRKLRTFVESFDSKIDDWANSSRGQDAVNMNVGNFETLESVSKAGILKHFDRGTGKYIFQGEEFDLKSIVGAVGEVAAKVKDIWNSTQSS